ncbi:hypothetical protein NLJ89_g6429 [Agrocybe chaxingu]|uniref:SCP domain-containing protein n=1 Tax=Agrocybe chaxingu TaxID=84603 RepID=A0A9W8MW12_9AGAR|nr:hypothetical protein NLJ89_g6429 [Agrocybe chaxingu]
MFFVALFYTFALLFTLFTSGIYAHVIPRHRHVPAIASRGSQRQIDAFLDAHNTIRASHSAPALTWSTSLAEKAELWADRCQFKHSDGRLSDTLYGENIAAATGDFTIPAAVATFISDEDKYDPANPSYLRFTQVVWKSTTELGCAVSQCRGLFPQALSTRTTLYVCLYNPAGNIVGKAP